MKILEGLLVDKHLDEEEQKVLSYLLEANENIAETYLAFVDKGRMGIIQRLLQAVVRENIIDESMISWREKEGRTFLQIHFPSGKQLLAYIQKRHSLGRFDLAETPVIMIQGEQNPIAHPGELLAILESEGLLKEAKTEQIERFKKEIKNGTAYYALALAGAASRKKTLALQARLANVQTSLEWVLHQMKADSMFSPLAFYEQWVVDGHPLHPGAKTKLGLDVSDVICYSPEWEAAPEVFLVAVHKEVCRTTTLDGLTVTEILGMEYSGLTDFVGKNLLRQGINHEHYEIIPVHPWQFRNTLSSRYAEEVEQKRIIPLEGFSIHTKALVSFRSLAPQQRRGQNKHHIKTAVNIQTTSAIRTVSPQSAENGPLLSSVLRDIQHRENHFGGKLVSLEERAGIYYFPDSEALSEEEKWSQQANLAAILRENPEKHIEEGEIPIVAAALLNESPIGMKPIVVELLEAFAVQRGLQNLTIAAIEFMRTYASTSLPGLITLMVRYGISLEAHMQNSISVFKNGELVRMIIRDYGGVRILPERLEKQGLSTQFQSGSSTVTDNVQDIQNILGYSIIQNHFAELITTIVRALGIAEEILWEPIRQVCRDVFQDLRKDPSIREQSEVDELAIFQSNLQLKALATMRLQGDISNYSFRQVSNPLS